MRPLESVLLQWLQLQCQMIHNVDQGLLFRPGKNAREQLLLKWPKQQALDADTQAIIKSANRSQKLTIESDHQHHILLAQPLKIGGAYWGLLILRLDQRNKEDLQACLRLLQWGISWLQLLLMQRQDDPSSQLLRLYSQTLKQASLAESAISWVNNIATLFNAERASLGFIHKKTIRLAAVSNSANFDARTAQMQTLSSAMLEAIEQRSDIHNPNKTADDKPVINRCHEALQKLNQSKSIHTYLLRHGDRIIGALTLERSSECPFNALEESNLAQCVQLAAQIFQLKIDAESPTHKRAKSQLINFFQRRFSTEHLVGKITCAALALLLLILLIPAEHWVYGDALLESQNKRIIVAPQDGYLKHIYARPGSFVQNDEILAELDDSDLRLQRRKIASQLQQHRQEYDEALANYNRSEATILSAQVEQAEAQLQLTEQQLKRTVLVAPMTGLVVSDDISQNLGAPVEQGQVLFMVASDDQYRVKLFIDEREVAALAKKMRGRLILSSLPNADLNFTVTQITPLSEVREGRNFFVVEGLLDIGPEQSLLRPGMTGSGKVYSQRRALGWIWFHDVFNALRVFLWL